MFKIKFLLPLIILSITIAAIFIRNSLLQNSSLVQDTISPSKIPTPTKILTPTPQKIKLTDLIKTLIESSEENYGIYIKNLNTNETYSLNEHISFEAASLYKLWVMGEVYQEIQNGKLSENQVLSADIAYLNSKFGIDPASAELTKGNITLSISAALTQMISISHNYSALLLSDKIGLSSLSVYLNSNNLSESQIGSYKNGPVTSAYDMGLFYEKLYRGQLANQIYTKKMIDVLKAQTLNDEIPKYLPISIEVAHKTGKLDLFYHDAGIVFAPKGDYLIVVMTQNENPQLVSGKIAQISKIVYNYFNQ